MDNSAISNNFDPEELRKFNDVAATWWDPDGAFRPLHLLNPARLAYVQSRCKLAGHRVLDVGCGGGILTESMAANGAQVTGIDIAGKALRVARLHLLESGLDVNYLESTVEQHAATGVQPYDVVTCMEMIEHVPDPAEVVRSIACLVKPGGDVFFSTVNRNFLAFGLAIVGAEYVARLLPRGTHRYDRFIKPSELAGWARAAGLVVSDISGLHYDPFGGSVKLGGHVRVNYLMHTRREAV
jgi:2-polyprenyl-6-hydroxyphenyl methylase/3-demethylubiquinone-9 3-methyltransferase